MSFTLEELENEHFSNDRLEKLEIYIAFIILCCINWKRFLDRTFLYLFQVKTICCVTPNLTFISAKLYLFQHGVYNCFLLHSSRRLKWVIIKKSMIKRIKDILMRIDFLSLLRLVKKETRLSRSWLQCLS